MNNSTWRTYNIKSRGTHRLNLKIYGCTIGKCLFFFQNELLAFINRLGIWQEFRILNLQ